jgi:hypothetical protein
MLVKIISTVLSFVALSAILSIPSAYGQSNGVGVKKEVPPASKETFEPYDGLVSKNRERTMIDDTFKIYDGNGFIWYEFSYDTAHPFFYENRLNKALKAVTPYEDYFTLRIKAISEHWYEVVVDEDACKTMYTLISDSFLSRRTWFDLLSESHWVVFDRQKNPAYASPEGKAADFDVAGGERVLFTVMRGDWMEVKKTGVNSYGWIKWRDDTGKLLLGIEANGWKVPESSGTKPENGSGDKTSRFEKSPQQP